MVNSDTAMMGIKKVTFLWVSRNEFERYIVESDRIWCGGKRMLDYGLSSALPSST